MGRPTDEFSLAWKALSGASDKEGWRSIAVAPAGPCVILAGRRFPGNEEALLAGFAFAKMPVAEKLPEGRGFEVSRADPHGDGKTWIALSRKESGNLDLFTKMVCDVAGALDLVSGDGEERLLRVLLSRIRAWQEFMMKGAQALSAEAEIGLAGELSFLAAVVRAGVPAIVAIESWVGPLEGIQDFELGTGAIEVKATLATQGFPAKISSLEQLDDALRKPLFVAGVRLRQSETGKTLPEIAQELEACLLNDAEALREFSDRLFAAGLHESHFDRYTRRFVADEPMLAEVLEGFPRLIQGSVPSGVRRVAYEIDLDKALGHGICVSDALHRVGVI